MSRIGKKPITVPKNVEVTLEGNTITVKGPKGTLTREYPKAVSFDYDKSKEKITVKRADDTKVNRALHGLWRALVQNMVVGVSEGYTRSLEIVGTGYRAQAKGKKQLTINIGFTHPVDLTMPDDVDVATPAPTEIVLTSCNKESVGQIAANIRRIRPPEPYKGKGIRYKGEFVRRLVGKTFGSSGK
ncbi:MAG: 50S ribosomal protein L6 [Planctomycetota bacterium]